MLERICAQCQRETNALVCPVDGFKTVEAARFRPANVDPMIGQLFEGRYQIDSVLGRGGFGVVYRALQVGIDRNVAVKLLSSDMGGNLQEVARFQQEARALATIKHPNIVDVYDFGQASDGSLYIVMEYLDGQSLDALLKERGSLSPEDTIEVGLQVFDALAEAHAQGIIHRDLKPANLLMTRGPRGRMVLKILDFGIARVSGEGGANVKLTKTGMVIGSPPYMSPEQCSGRGEVTTQSDLYSVGCILYECLTGRQLFKLPTPTSYLVAHVMEPPDPPTIGSSRAYGPLVDAILELLAKHPLDRPDGADAAHQLLQAALAQPITHFDEAPNDATLSVPSEKIFSHSANQRAAAADSAFAGTGQNLKATADHRKPKSGEQKAPAMLERVPRAARGEPASTGIAASPAKAKTKPKAKKSRAGLYALLVMLVVGGGAAAVVLSMGHAKEGPKLADAKPVTAPTVKDKPAGETPKPEAPKPETPKPEAPKPEAPKPEAPKPEAPPTKVVEVPVEPPKPVEAPKPYSVEVQSVPVAKIVQDGKEIGQTPMAITWARDATAPKVTLTAKGYLDLAVTLDANKDGAAQALTLKRKPAASSSGGASGPTW